MAKQGNHTVFLLCAHTQLLPRPGQCVARQAGLADLTLAHPLLLLDHAIGLLCNALICIILFSY